MTDKFQIEEDHSEWLEPKTKRSHKGKQGLVNSTHCRKNEPTACKGFRRLWLPKGYLDWPCDCRCHDEADLKPRLVGWRFHKEGLNASYLFKRQQQIEARTTRR